MLYSPETLLFLLLVLISVRGREKPQGLVWMEELGKLEKINSPHRVLDLPACSIAYANACPKALQVLLVIQAKTIPSHSNK
jgi:hypothetical protein